MGRFNKKVKEYCIKIGRKKGGKDEKDLKKKKISSVFYVRQRYDS